MFGKFPLEGLLAIFENDGAVIPSEAALLRCFRWWAEANSEVRISDQNLMRLNNILSIPTKRDSKKDVRAEISKIRTILRVMIGSLKTVSKLIICFLYRNPGCMKQILDTSNLSDGLK